MSDFIMETGADGVAIITWDCPDKSMNVMSLDGFANLRALIDQALANTEVKGVVITSAKKDFAGGMDLNVLTEMQKGGAGYIFDSLMMMHDILRRIELAGMDAKTKRGGKPIAAALPGTALGIGMELALSTHRIFAADNPRAMLGFPEMKIGIFPGAGGTTRLTRKLGLMGAAPFLIQSRLVDPRGAQAAGLIDEVVPPEELLDRAKAWVLSASPDDTIKPWDRKDYRMPGGAPYHPSGYLTFAGASSMVNGESRGAYPAAKEVLSAIYQGALVPFETALRIEARHFTTILLNPSSTAMIRTLFINKSALEKGANRPESPDQRVSKLGVLGAGVMGAGIAFVAAIAGIKVALVDATPEAAERGKARIAALLDKGISHGKITGAQKEKALANLAVSDDYTVLDGADLVIEAVFEDPHVKHEAISRSVAIVDGDAIIATNTSTLPITSLAGATPRPEDFIGIHFFSPVERMALVEIIKGARTGPRAVAKALDFTRQIRKTPIIVNDSRFFYANRCIIPYINEGMRMVAEGIAPPLIENAARMAGMPVGPLQLVDEVSLSLGASIAKTARAAMGSDYPDEEVDRILFWMVEQGRAGHRVNAGFYAYAEDGKRIGLWEGLGHKYPRDKLQPPITEVQNRLLMAQALPAVTAFESGVLADIREGDVGAVLGWGFAPWSGGPFSWLDIIGADRAVEICRSLSAQFGHRFNAPPLLRELAAQDETFYGRFGAGNRATR